MVTKKWKDVHQEFTGAGQIDDGYNGAWYMLRHEHKYNFGPLPIGEMNVEGIPLVSAVFGIHGSLMLEPAETMSSVWPVHVAGFYGMNHPSKFRCEIMHQCEPWNAEVDEKFKI